MEEYAKVIHIEALTSLDMLGKMIVPACAAYSRCWRKALRRKRASAWTRLPRWLLFEN